MLFSGFNAVQETWNAVVPPLTELSTVFTYDRSGYGKSEIGDLPTHEEQSTKILNVLLKSLDVSKPYLLVGHSYGVRVVRLYGIPEAKYILLEELRHAMYLEDPDPFIKIISGLVHELQK